MKKTDSFIFSKSNTYNMSDQIFDEHMNAITEKYRKNKRLRRRQRLTKEVMQDLSDNVLNAVEEWRADTQDLDKIEKLKKCVDELYKNAVEEQAIFMFMQEVVGSDRF